MALLYDRRDGLKKQEEQLPEAEKIYIAEDMADVRPVFYGELKEGRRYLRLFRFRI